MADNFLEKHYDEYLARKNAWQKKGASLHKARFSILTLSALEVPSDDFAASKDFYCSIFGFVESDKNALSMPNGEFILSLIDKKNDNFIHFTLKMASKYQYEQLINRLKVKNIKFFDAQKSLKDPSGNIVVVEY